MKTRTMGTLAALALTVAALAGCSADDATNEAFQTVWGKLSATDKGHVCTVAELREDFLAAGENHGGWDEILEAECAQI